ncbi:tetratricopeptide repeat protein [Serinicoccus kebangsaanensis]|uniref:tetratricopeptide repeat protein n=1 Tax=Serinicoccus kebangsaanensis TaxID=2602069 RepID=UPI00124DC7BE|nr:tetratricopeptide repeat protein [Serinicoccus kebangsaanensis]
MTVVFGGAEFPAYVIDDETLREELLDEDETREWVEETPDDPHAVALLRMLGELERALTAGQDRLHEQDPGTPAWATAAVRLAHVHHWRGEYAEAHELLDAAQQVFAGDDARTAFVLQHRAKVCFDEGRPEQARDSARAALTLREGAGDAGLIASTRQTLARIERELDLRD